MSWGYRLCKKKTEEGYEYGIYEVYYNDNGEIWGMAEKPSDVYAFVFTDFGEFDENAVNEIRDTLDHMREATKAPLLDLDNIKFAMHDFAEELEEIKKGYVKSTDTQEKG